MFLQHLLIPIAVTIDMSFAADNVRGLRRLVSDTAEPMNIDDNMSMIAAVFEDEPENEMFTDAAADEDPIIDTTADDMDHADRFAGTQSMSYVYEEDEDGAAFL